MRRFDNFLKLLGSPPMEEPEAPADDIEARIASLEAKVGVGGEDAIASEFEALEGNIEGGSDDSQRV